MERDFMGLSNMQGLRKIKEEEAPHDGFSHPDLKRRSHFGGVNHKPTPPHRRNKAASSGPQLTVFYGGTVNVFNDISPHKAQAIILWAGNGLSQSSTLENPKPVVGQRRGAYGNHALNASPNAAAAPAVSVSSSSATHSAESVSISIDKPPPVVAATKAIRLMGSFCAAPNMMPSVPQARKASLARFLEKRKERLMNAMPYGMTKTMLLLESTGINYSSAA